LEYGAGSGEHEDKQSQCRRAPILGASDATRCHLSVHSLALPHPGSGDDSRGGGTRTGAPEGG